MHLTGILSHLREINYPFACYKLPSSEDPVLLAGGKYEELSSVDELKDKSGFIIHPFELDKPEPVLVFNPEKVSRGWEASFKPSDLGNTTPGKQSHYEPPPVIDFQTYISQASRLIKMLRDLKLEKVVLTRILSHSLGSSFNIGQFFQRLCEKYPDAFVYIFNDGNGRCWAGASPELLLAADGKKGRSVSLAATQPSDSASGTFIWDEKEKREQELVTQYISQTLRKHGVSEIRDSELETIIAGPVAHLRRKFEFDIPSRLYPLQLAAALHPTPAVCGLPVDAALQAIHDTEIHNRGFYCGFIGPVSNKENVNLFVNLRCMQIIGNKAYLFAGGGLLARSEKKKEWNETLKKADTLLSMLKK